VPEKKNETVFFSIKGQSSGKVARHKWPFFSSGNAFAALAASG
jgi:hypothetical protein